MDSGNRYWVKFANSSRLRLRGRSLLRRIVKKTTPDPAMLHKPENTSKPDQVRLLLPGLCPGSSSPCNTPVPDRRGTGGETRSHSPYNLRRRDSTKKVQFRQ